MAEMRTDEGKSGKELGVKANMAKAKPKVGPKKDDMAGRMKAKGMPYTQSTQSGKFDEGRGQHAKQWGSSPSFNRKGGMPYDMWGPSPKYSGANKSGEKVEIPVKSEGGRGRGR